MATKLAMSSAETKRLISVSEVAAKYGASSRWVWRQVSADPKFPQPVKVSANLTRWYENEVDTHITNLGNDR